MRVEWYGQSAFKLTGDDTTVFIDPFGDVSGLASRGIEWSYPPVLARMKTSTDSTRPRSTPPTWHLTAARWSSSPPRRSARFP